MNWKRRDGEERKKGHKACKHIAALERWRQRDADRQFQANNLAANVRGGRGSVSW